MDGCVIGCGAVAPAMAAAHERREVEGGTALLDVDLAGRRPVRRPTAPVAVRCHHKEPPSYFQLATITFAAIRTGADQTVAFQVAQLLDWGHLDRLHAPSP